ncbi:MAG: phosphatase PAP2 family protein [Gemmatimonadaceae bacterium]
MHRPRIKLTTPLMATAAVGAAGFAAVSTLVAQHRTKDVDTAVRKRLVAQHSKGATVTVKALSYAGKSWVHGPLAALMGQYVEHKGSLEGSRAINLASTLATTASKTFDWALPHHKPPPGRHAPREQSYPSGHTMETGAVALVCAYVLWREGLADGRVVFPIAAAVPLLAGGGRLYLDRHWMSDVVGGLLGGITVAAVCAAGYEMKTERWQAGQLPGLSRYSTVKLG